MAVLGVAAVGCVSAAVAGEMLQDLKVGHILGGTPWKMQVGRHHRRHRGQPGDVLPALHDAHLRRRAVRRRGRLRRQDLPGAAGRPHGGAVAGHRRRRDGVAAGGRRHRDGHLAHPDQGARARCSSRSACICRSGRPSRSSAAAWSAGVVDRLRDKRGYNAAQKARVENAGVLAASGLIAGEALVGLFIAAVVGIRAEPRVLVGVGLRDHLAVAGAAGGGVPGVVPGRGPAAQGWRG